MVELVDTQDLKSCSRKRSAGSIPALSTKPDTDVSGFAILIVLFLSTNFKLIPLTTYNNNIDLRVSFQLLPEF